MREEGVKGKGKEKGKEKRKTERRAFERLVFPKGNDNDYGHRWLAYDNKIGWYRYDYMFHNYTLLRTIKTILRLHLRLSHNSHLNKGWLGSFHYLSFLRLRVRLRNLLVSRIYHRARLGYVGYLWIFRFVLFLRSCEIVSKK